jgi:hypothetical protein
MGFPEVKRRNFDLNFDGDVSEQEARTFDVLDINNDGLLDAKDYHATPEQLAASSVTEEQYTDALQQLYNAGALAERQAAEKHKKPWWNLVAHNKAGQAERDARLCFTLAAGLAEPSAPSMWTFARKTIQTDALRHLITTYTAKEDERQAAEACGQATNPGTNEQRTQIAELCKRIPKP